MKNTFKIILAKAHLLWMVDVTRFLYAYIKFFKKNYYFKKSNKNFIPPHSYLQFEATGSVNWEYFYNSGKEQAIYLSEQFKKHGIKNGNILEWGCGPARILRHMPSLITGEFYGTDYNSKSIAYDSKHFKDIKFSTNNLNPPLNFKNDYFNGIYCVSVLTHLSFENGIAWLEELFRLISFKGVIILTTQGNYYCKDLTDAEANVFSVVGAVVRENYSEGKKWFMTYHNPDYLSEVLKKKNFTVLEHIEKTPFDWFRQDYWILTKS